MKGTIFTISVSAFVGCLHLFWGKWCRCCPIYIRNQGGQAEDCCGPWPTFQPSLHHSPSLLLTPKMTNVSWQSDGFSSLSCGLPCSLAPPYPKGSSSLAIVSLDGGGGKVKVEAEGFPSGILLAAASLNAHTIFLSFAYFSLCSTTTASLRKMSDLGISISNRRSQNLGIVKICFCGQPF